jgi:fido (protein-threonine AMPylation protein)
MPTLHEKLAASLEKLKELQSGGRRVFQSKELPRLHRERLLKQGFLREATKGWLISTSPGTPPGDTTPWFASFWEFCARYSDARFGKDWHLSAEQSLLLHAEHTVIPNQVLIYSPRGTNNTISLLFGTSLYDLKESRMPRETDLTKKDGLRLFAPAAAFIRVSEDFMRRYPLEVQVVLAGIKDASEVLNRLLEGGHTRPAGRLAGAFARIGRKDIADEIIKAMRAASHDARLTNPFAPQQSFAELAPGLPPILGRLQALWSSLREPVIHEFPKAPGLPSNPEAYLAFVEEIYKSDAYHSLSIEGYRVSPELIERVRAGTWSPETRDADRESKDALAARGYWQAFQKVKEDVGKIIAGANAGRLVHATHRDWHREMFQPCVAAGVIKSTALAGYRNHPVYLRGSRYAPPRWEVLPDAMNELFSLLEAEQEPAVRVVLGHWLMGYIHPYPDGNGRMARFLMNAMLAAGGYPWTVIRVEDRDAYTKALESASADTNIRPFAAFIATRVRWSMERSEEAQRSAKK